MPITKSAKKALRKSEKNRERNLVRQNSLNKVVKTFKRMVKEKKLDEAKTYYSQIQKALDKATKQGILKANTASRKKSRLFAKIRS